MNKPEKQKRKRTAVKVAPLNDGTNIPVPGKNSTVVLSDGEAALYKQAQNPLGDPHKI